MPTTWQKACECIIVGKLLRIEKEDNTSPTPIMVEPKKGCPILEYHLDSVLGDKAADRDPYIEPWVWDFVKISTRRRRLCARALCRLLTRRWMINVSGSSTIRKWLLNDSCS